MPAKTAVITFEPQRWKSESVFIHHYSNLIALVGSIEGVHLARFIAGTVTKKWLAENYQRATVGGLAGALFTLSRRLAVEFHDAFYAPQLIHRIEHILRSDRITLLSESQPLRFYTA